MLRGILVGYSFHSAFALAKRKTKTLKNVKANVEFYAAIVTIVAGFIAILVGILK